MIKKICFLLLTLVALSCDTYDIRLKISNSGAETLYVAFSQNDAIGTAEEITFNGPDEKHNRTREILPGTTETIEKYGTDARTDFIRHSKNGKMRIFIINRHQFSSNNWETISKGKRYSYKVEISLKELEAKNWNLDLSNLSGIAATN